MNGWPTVNVPVASRWGLGTSAAMSPLQREAASERGFDPFRHFRAPLMRTKSRPPTPLKEQGNRSLRCGTVWRRMPPRSRRRKIVSFALSRRPNVAVHYGLKSMFEAQQVRSVRHRSVHATRACRRDVLRLPSECSIRYLHRQTGSAPDSSPFRHGVRGRPAFKRFANGQQDAHRRDPSRRNPGGRLARQSCRRV